MSFCVYGDKTCNLANFRWLLACAVNLIAAFVLNLNGFAIYNHSLDIFF